MGKNKDTTSHEYYMHPYCAIAPFSKFCRLDVGFVLAFSLYFYPFFVIWIHNVDSKKPTRFYRRRDRGKFEICSE